jgi:hypothetical protein
VDTTDLVVLDQAARRLTRARGAGGALGAGLALLDPGGREPRDDRHPAALGCLLAVVVPAVDPVALALHDLAARSAPRRGSDGGGLVLDDAGVAAHVEVGRRLVARLHRTG